MTTQARLRLLRRSLTGAVWACLGAWAAWATPAEGQSLRGSSASLDVQNRQARGHDFTYIATGSQVRRFAEAGYLVRVRGNRDFELHAVSFPYARPETELFIRRLASQYRGACGEKLVVTSLTRPLNRQPRNASDRSVHPTGMAIDLRYSRNRACRRWLEGVLLSLEERGVLEATRERYPAHYHVALFPRPYASYVERITSGDRADRRRVAQRAATTAPTIEEYRVRYGDSLWTIARAHGVSLSELRASNDLRSSRIHPGQVLRVPVRAQR